MNDANYIEMDVHRATISVTALNSAVCATLGAKRKKSRGGNKQYGVALISASPGPARTGRGVPKLCGKNLLFTAGHRSQ
jgi:hypothetical protein